MFCAPAAISSTTLAAPMMLAPVMRWSSVMSRGFVHAPHAQIVPPLSMNSSISPRRAGMPGKCMSSAYPLVASQAPSTVSST